MKLGNRLRLFGAGLALLVGFSVVPAQNTSAGANNLSESRRSLIEATQEFKSSTEAVLRFEEEEANKATLQVEELRKLYAEGLIARSELEESEQALAAARESLSATRQQLSAADHMIVEIKAAEELAKNQPARPLTRPTASYSSSSSIIRHTGAINTVSNLAQISAFFSSRFGRPLPLSAVGQTPTHNRLGFDHRHAVDVPLHPDSVEGKALMNYLQQQGITFLAFRGAIPGVSTGPHIHIGRPSHRIS